MRHVLLTLIILLTSSHALAQENKPPDPKPTPETATGTEKPKNEVDQMLADLSSRGETVLATCPVEDCSSKNSAESGVENGRVLQLPKPAYPAIARMAHASGTVKVQVIISEEGKVIAAAAIEGHPLLFGVSVAAARDSVFTPTKFHGKPVKVVGVLQYDFVAQ